MPVQKNGIFIPKFLLPILVVLVSFILGGIGLKAATSISRAEALETFVTQKGVERILERVDLIDQKLDRLIERGNR